jgi:hypothetical protein
MTENPQTQPVVNENVNAAVEQVTKTADTAVTLGRKVTALWLGVSRSAIEAAAKTLTTTSEMISSVADSMGELSERIEGRTKKA